MSQENLDLVVRATQAALKRPKPDFETVNALYHPDHVLVPLAANTLGEGEAKGAEGYIGGELLEGHWSQLGQLIPAALQKER
jgi:hypothetical protein